MKIGLVTPLPLETGGVANYGHFLLKALLEEGGENEFVVFSTNRTRPRHEKSLRIIPVLDTNGDYSSKLADEILKIRPDILHIQHDYEIFGLDARFLDFLEILRTEDVKTIVTLHSVYDKDYCPTCEGDVDIESYQRSMGLLAERLIVHHGFPSKRSLQNMGVPSRKLKVIRHGTWNYERPDTIDARRFLGLPEEDIIIGVIGNYGSFTDMGFFEAIPHLKNYERRVLFWIVGNSERYGFDADAIEKDAILKGFGNNVIVSDIQIPTQWIKHVFTAPDVILIPMRGERESTITLHYALPSGKPVVVLKDSMAREEVAFFISRELFYKEGDTNTLTELIFKLISNENFRNKISCRMRRYGVKTDWSNVAKMHLVLYRSLERERIYPSFIRAIG